MLVNAIGSNAVRRKMEEISAPHPLPTGITVQAALLEVLNLPIVPLTRVSLSEPDVDAFFRASVYSETLADRLDRTYGREIEVKDPIGFMKLRTHFGCDEMTPLDRFRPDPVRFIRSSLRALHLYATYFLRNGESHKGIRFTQLIVAMSEDRSVVAGEIDGHGSWIAFAD